MTSVAAAQLAPRWTDLPPAVRERLERAGRLGRQRAEAVYLVGGMVRDALLGKPSLDIDLVVVGDGLAFAAELARQLTAPLRIHREFLTAQIDDPELGSIDVATSRRESYRAPAALPTVAPAAITEDLGRRDFAVNALAQRLDHEGLLDPWGGLADLAARRLRVLHERSFEDDPTRILRGVRLGARLGFAFDRKTELLARRAIASDAFAPLSGARLAGELELLAELDPPLRQVALDRLTDLDFFVPVLGVSGPTGEVPAVGDRLVGLLLAAARDQDETALADRLQFAGERRRRLVGAAERARRARVTLTTVGVKAHQAHQVLADLGVEELALLALEPPPVAPWIAREVEEMRPLTLLVQGRDLVANGVAPGPRIGEILQQVKRARLDGELSREDELARALKLAREAR